MSTTDLPPGYRIRKATPQDLPAVMELEELGFAPGIVEEEPVFRRRIQCFSDGFLLLDRGEGTRPEGYLTAELWSRSSRWEDYSFALNHDLSAVLDSSGPVLYVASMTVHPESRGQGLGARFFRSSLAFLLKDFPWVEEVYLVVGEYWQRAFGLYSRCGFETQGRVPGFLEPAGRAPEAVLVMKAGRNSLQL